MCIMIAVFFYLGPSVVYYMPRVMPGCLLIHIGIDLSTEALVDSYPALDIVEYSSVVAITLVMTFYGMTAGLGLGVLCAALTFTIQVGC
jgi:MFS superfamily sulfate permease-like transporter